MWIFKNDAFLSIVAHRDLPGSVLVRSRVAGDIQRALPGAKVFEDAQADYQYRAIVKRDVLAQALFEAVDDINYPNFKDSVDDAARHDAYMAVWQAMAMRYGAYGRKPVAELLAGTGAEDDDIDEFLNG